jgi:TolB-like protein/Tfp pilus assembly protein PilF
MPSLFAELIRRNVFRSAALYLAATWLILQVADLVLDAFDGSPSIMRGLIVAFTIGFPVFVLLSWFYDLRGTRLVKDTGRSNEASRGWSSRAVNATIVVLVILAAGIFSYSRIQSTPDPVSVEAPPPAVADSGTTIAILPFANISNDPADEYLADGLTEELLNVLISVPQLRVTARASSFAFGNDEKDVRTIGKQLGVGHVIEGSVRKEGDRLRIAVQLVSTSTGQSLWSATYDRTLSQIFDVQRDIAERVSGTLQLSLFSDPVPIIRRTSPEAYSAYLRALQQYRAGGRDNYAEAVANLETVIELDDQYAPAWTLLSSVRNNQAIIGAVDYAEGHEMARDYTDRALAIDPNYAYAISSRAWLAMSYERDFALAARYFKRALELAPNDAAILSNLAVLARLLGRIDRAIELTNQSLSQNPLSGSAFSNLSDQLYQGRRYADAIDSARRALQLAPGSPNAIVNLAVTQIFAENPAAALQTMAEFELPFYRLFIEALARYDLGDLPSADAALATLIDEYGDERAAYIAAIHARRGNEDDAFAWLQRAIDERQRTLAMRTEPLFENLHDDSRWQRVLEQLGLSDQQVAGIEI